MNKIPKIEINCIPSQLNTSKPTGVASQLASVAQNESHYDGVTIGQMKNNPLYQRLDDIDKVGLAKAQLQQSAKTVKSNMKKIRAINDIGQKMNKIPSKN